MVGAGGGVEDELPSDDGGWAGVGDLQELQDWELVSGALNTTSSKAIGGAIPDFRHVVAGLRRIFPARQVIVLQRTTSTCF